MPKSNSGLNVAELGVGDGTIGFWAADNQIFPGMRHQRYWVHETANVLNKLPKSAQSKDKLALHEIWIAETEKNAEAAFDLFIKTYEDKYLGTLQCLLKN